MDDIRDNFRRCAVLTDEINKLKKSANTEGWSALFSCAASAFLWYKGEIVLGSMGAGASKDLLQLSNDDASSAVALYDKRWKLIEKMRQTEQIETEHFMWSYNKQLEIKKLISQLASQKNDPIIAKRVASHEHTIKIIQEITQNLHLRDAFWNDSAI